MINKLEKDGNVAVLYSPGYGAGWYTWNSDSGEQTVFDPVLAQLVLDNTSPTVVAEVAKQRYPKAYTGGVSDGLEIEWLPKGTEFYIDEYDGSESVITQKQLTFTA